MEKNDNAANKLFYKSWIYPALVVKFTLTLFCNAIAVCLRLQIHIAMPWHNYRKIKNRNNYICLKSVKTCLIFYYR